MEQNTRVLLKHLSGSRKGEAQDFPLGSFSEIVIGRDPSAHVRFDPDKDDLVGRQHAKIAPDGADPASFTITDLSSRNGTIVNKQRIHSPTRINPGDVIQFGPGGPELLFDLNPRPAGYVRPTRMADSPFASNAVPPTREAKTKSESRSYVIYGGVAMLALIALITGFLIYQNRSTQHVPDTGQQEQREGQLSAPAWAAITKKYNDAVVKIEVGWHLIHSISKGVLYHQIAPVPGRGDLPTFIEVFRGNERFFEPYLTTDPKNKKGVENLPIGGNHSGSGFVVRPEGYILTNRHVAATWEGQYEWPTHIEAYQKGGLVLRFVLDPIKGFVWKGNKLISPNEFPQNWVPAKSNLLGEKLIEGKLVEGEFEYLDVAFANDRLRRRARLILSSDRHDVALIKLDVSDPLNYVTTYDNYDEVKKQDPVLVMGYPAVTPRRREITSSAQGLGSDLSTATVSDPTATSGAIQNILRNQVNSDQTVFSDIGDAYQLQINTTGGGNSGGPVFDEKGRVIAIFYAGAARAGAVVSFAVPIRYGLELMKPGTTASK